MTTPTRTRIVPREGLKLRDPKTGKSIPPEGIVVSGDLGTFWHKRLQSGDVEAKPEPQS